MHRREQDIASTPAATPVPTSAPIPTDTPDTTPTPTPPPKSDRMPISQGLIHTHPRMVVDFSMVQLTMV